MTVPPSDPFATTVQALLLWEAPSINVQKYEEALEDKLKVKTSSRELAFRQTAEQV